MQEVAMESAPVSRPMPMQRHTSSVAHPGGVMAMAISTVRSMSVASISSEGSTESHGVEQEEIAALTHDVRNFKEALAHLRRLFHADRDTLECGRVAAHERLGEVLRILRTVLEKHPALQYTELLVAAGSLIQLVKGHNYEDEKSNPKEFFDSIDQLALAFSSRVSEYLMGDLDASTSLSSSVSSKTKSYETLAAKSPGGRNWGRSGGGVASEEGPSGEHPDSDLLRTEHSVEGVLRLAKGCSKYLKDMSTYAEKRANLDLEYSKNLSKLAQTVRPLISEESHLPLQSIYCTALDHDISNCNTFQATSAEILGERFLEPMSERRSEHERRRKQLKEQWQREVKRLHEAVGVKRKAYTVFAQRQQAVRAAAGPSSEVSETGTKQERRRRAEEENMHKALEAEEAYKVASMDVEDRALQLQRVKAEVLHSLQALLLQFDITIKAATMNLFQLQHAATSRAPAQFQSLYESSCQYEPGMQYHEFVSRFCKLTSQKHSLESSASFSGVEKEPRSLDSLSLDHDFSLNPQGPDGKAAFSSKKAWVSSCPASDTDSSHSTKSREPSPTSTRPPQADSEDISKHLSDTEGPSSQTSDMSRAAMTHRFNDTTHMKTRCPECDTKVFRQALECSECGLICHKECTKTLCITCGPTRLPERQSVFGVELMQHLAATGVTVPRIVTKCIQEIEQNGITMKGLYRCSGVKSKVEKLCHDFEVGAERVDLSGINAHVIASVLKLYLRQLPEPLLTFKQYPNFVRIAKECAAPSDASDAVCELERIVNSLPPHYLAPLASLMHHLQRVSMHCEENSMTSRNLGIVFGPTLLRLPDMNLSAEQGNAGHQTRAIELLITNAKQLFPAPNQDIKQDRNQEEYTSLTSEVVAAMQVALPGFILENNASQTKDSMSSPDGDIGPDDIILGFTSDDELPESLLPDCSPLEPSSPLLQRSSNTQIFRGALRDYKGLEGNASLILNLPDATESSHSGILRKSKSEANNITIKKSVEHDESRSVKEVHSTAAKVCTLARVESLADFDYECHEARREELSMHETSHGEGHRTSKEVCQVEVGVSSASSSSSSVVHSSLKLVKSHLGRRSSSERSSQHHTESSSLTEKKQGQQRHSSLRLVTSHLGRRSSSESTGQHLSDSSTVTEKKQVATHKETHHVLNLRTK